MTVLFYLPKNFETFWKEYENAYVTASIEEGLQELPILWDEWDEESPPFLGFFELWDHNYIKIIINGQEFRMKNYNALYYSGMYLFEYSGHKYIFFEGHNKGMSEHYGYTIFLFDVTDEENTQLVWCNSLYKYKDEANDYYGPKVGMYGGKLCFLITEWLHDIPEYIQYGWVVRTKLYTLETDGLAEALDSEGRSIELDYDWEKNGDGKIIRKHIPANPHLLDYTQNKTDAWKLIPFQSGKKVGPLEDIIAAKIARIESGIAEPDETEEADETKNEIPTQLVTHV